MRRPRRGRAPSLRTNPLEQIMTLTMPAIVEKISLAAASTFSFTRSCTTIASTLAPAGIQIVSRFAEWRILRANITLTPLSTNGGSSAFWFSDEAGITPSNFQDFNKEIFPNSNSSMPMHKISWRPNDFATLSFQPTGSAFLAPLYNFYGYTNSATLGTPVSTTDLWTIAGEIVLQCRGLTQ